MSSKPTIEMSLPGLSPNSSRAALMAPFTYWIPHWYGSVYDIDLPGLKAPIQTQVSKMIAIWSVQAALLVGIVTGSNAERRRLLLPCPRRGTQCGLGTRGHSDGDLYAPMIRSGV
ncbi:hypothetical protein [Pseudomonas fluorescens]|uniref:Uncharacterized protein n=1 Tax=Pseudomonas fluorescens TaxID=294 RepID=A0A0F4V300_PSEFL|nr:hypothetical protein [Pseudomonas fluorescens]KJZ62905.1 hypothetical protein VD17_25535 [Pseudomonas fluorescens]